MEATSRPEMPAKRKNRKKGTSAFCYRFHNGRFYEWSHADVHGDPHPATRCFRFFPCPFSFFFIFFFLLFFVVLPKSGRAEERKTGTGNSRIGQHPHVHFRRLRRPVIIKPSLRKLTIAKPLIIDFSSIADDFPTNLKKFLEMSHPILGFQKKN